MNITLKNEFLQKWERYFGKAELPFVWFYSPDPGTATVVKEGKGWSCIICELAKVRNGETLAYNEAGLRCGGSRRYLGYAKGMRPNFEYFLSCGIPGEMEGERYIRTPEMVREVMRKMQMNRKESFSLPHPISFPDCSLLQTSTRWMETV
jgi:hypothetical protein